MNNNINPSNSKKYIGLGNNNTEMQINYKNINTTNQNDKTINYNNKYLLYIKPLLLLLQKAEQIISIINLPSSSIDKYNQLKEISFKKCGLEYTPLIKNNDLVKNFQKENNNNNNKNIQNINKFKIINELSISKNKLLDIILTFIETTNFVNINNTNIKDNKTFLNNSNDFNINCNKLKEDINLIINEKNINSNINDNQINDEENFIFNEKEKLLNYILRAQQNLISKLYENDKKFNELKEAFLIQNSKIEYLNKYIHDIDELISPIWNKYYNNEIDWFNPNNIIDKYELKTYTKSHFLLNFMNQLFTDNKNLMEALTEMEKKKNEAYNILKMPYIKNVIEKGEHLKNIENLLKELNEDKVKNKNVEINKLINDGKELINNIKETISEESDKNNNINTDNEIINNYNDDMNIFLGKLMNGIQNILNKVDISNKKDELIENMLKVNISKNKNLSLDNSNFNMNATNMSNIINKNNITYNGIMSKDTSFISAANNNDINNSKIQNMSFQVYKKKTNHISSSNININNNKNEIQFNDKNNNSINLDTKRNDSINEKLT